MCCLRYRHVLQCLLASPTARLLREQQTTWPAAQCWIECGSCMRKRTAKLNVGQRSRCGRGFPPVIVLLPSPPPAATPLLPPPTSSKAGAGAVAAAHHRQHRGPVAGTRRPCRLWRPVGAAGCRQRCLAAAPTGQAAGGAGWADCAAAGRAGGHAGKFPELSQRMRSVDNLGGNAGISSIAENAPCSPPNRSSSPPHPSGSGRRHGEAGAAGAAARAAGPQPDACSLCCGSRACPFSGSVLRGPAGHLVRQKSLL